MIKYLHRTKYLSHKYCFICLSKSNKLTRVSKGSINLAYRKYNLIIKNGLRLCNSHNDSTKTMKSTEFVKIETIKTNLEKEDEPSCCIFDNFKRIDEIDDDFCKIVTGWNKSVFIQFCLMIKSTHETDGRCLEELVAIYRFWLRKGSTQLTISLMKSNTDQRQISRYLNSIRTAIYKDFTPLYVGTDKERNIYLQHNTESALTLHKLNKDDLIVVADGTYVRVEHSSNNNFQYNSYSMQKSNNLIKPFILCCADGYILDVYGPFSARLNDSRIFEIILQRDHNLKRLFSPYRTALFLDRGIIIFC